VLAEGAGDFKQIVEPDIPLATFNAADGLQRG
jgi:hypothetical protein